MIEQPGVVPAWTEAVIALSATAASLGMTAFWALAGRLTRSARARRPMAARSLYWYEPDGLCNERGITARLSGAPKLPDRATATTVVAPGSRQPEKV